MLLAAAAACGDTGAMESIAANGSAGVVAPAPAPTTPNIQPAAAPPPPVVAAPSSPAAPAQARPSAQFDPPAPQHPDVIFDWKETDPTRTVACKAGRYVGSYMCRLFIIRTEGEGAFDVAGTVDLRLDPSADGEFLRVRNGKFSSATLAAIPVEADVVGELNCSSSKFDGRLENGTFSVALGLPVPFTQGTFSGPLAAEYDPATAALHGTWNMTGELDGFPGSCMNGNWSATWLE